MFDEVYFVQFAQDYLSAEPSFDAHPPLGKYFIAAGIWLHSNLLSGLPTVLSSPLKASPVGAAPVGYRWMNALLGSCIPLVTTALAYCIGKQSNLIQNSRLRAFALLSGTMVAIDGLFMVESRYGLINTYMVLLGLLSQWLWLLKKGAKHSCKRIGLSVLAGMCLGGAIATKWNGLGFMLTLLLWEVCLRTNQETNQKTNQKLPRLLKAAVSRFIPLLFYIVIVPSITYYLIWLPHLWLTQEGFWAVHSSLFSFHHRLAPDGHSACSQWFTWPLLIKPITYWYQEKKSLDLHR